MFPSFFSSQKILLVTELFLFVFVLWNLEKKYIGTWPCSRRCIIGPVSIEANGDLEHFICSW